MASTMTLKDRLDIAAKDAEAAQEKITSGTLGREAFRQEVRNYTLAKFFLTEDEVRALGTEDILKLADESVEKLLRQNDKSVKLAEGSTTCTNQSSTDIKKVLLSLTLQRALNVRFTPEQSAELEQTHFSMRRTTRPCAEMPDELEYSAHGEGRDERDGEHGCGART